MGSVAVLLPEFVLLAFALFIVVAGFLVRRPAVLWGLAVAGLAATLVLTFDLMGLGLTRALGLTLWNSPVGPEGVLPDLKMKVDLFALFFHTVFLFVALIAVLASRSYLRSEEPHQAEYYGLMFLAVVGMMFTAAATDLFVLYLAFEVSSIATFALVAFRKRDKLATEAGLKFFIIGAVSSAIILFGISLIYGVSGTVLGAPTTDLATLQVELIYPRASMFEAPLIVAVVFLIAGFGFKVATVPFHMWAPDVYQGSPTTITVFLAAGSKKVGIVAMFKVFVIGLLGIQIDWLAAIAILAIVTQTVGNVLAIPQRNIKRMLAYSSIAQAGYILIAIAVAALAIRPDPGAQTAAAAGVQGGLYHVLTHAIMKGGAFLAVAAVSMTVVGEQIDSWKGLSRRMPLVSFSMAIFLLSLAGIPPLGGFFSKFILFGSAVNAASYNPWYLALAVSGVLNSALSLYYYARVIWYMYMLEPTASDRLESPRSITAAVVLCLVLIIATGLAAFLFVDYLAAAAVAFLG